MHGAVARRLPQRIVVHGRFTPGVRRGGVETFGRTLAEVFEEVSFTASGDDLGPWVRARALVVCDNQTALDWPAGYPVIGFQHGFAPEKAMLTHTLTDARLAWQQLRAARRPATVWVACARWIAEAFRRVQPAAARARPSHVIHHFVDVERFDGRRDPDPRLVLHDARSEHKGKRVIAAVAAALPEWRFEPLSCAPDEVPARMRQGAAFLHLSKYEGNSIVVNEAMAMDLPCLLTDVGLCRDLGRGELEADVAVIPRAVAFGPSAGAVAAVREFLGSLATRRYRPREFILRHATAAVAREKWRAAIDALEAMHRAQAGDEVAS